MGLILLFILCVCSLNAAYTDPELESLWASLSNLNDPTLEDYKLIESYLKNGERPYLRSLFDNSLDSWSSNDIYKRIQQRRNFKLIGPNDETPVFKLLELNVTERTKDRCILIYASFNPPYPSKAYRLLDELKMCGYSGNVMFRIGGFPNVSKGGIKFCPYLGVWKNEFIKEALSMGFTKILHLDTSIHPLTDLNSVFETINEKGYYSLSIYTNPPYLHLYQHLDYLKFPPEARSDIPWLPGYFIGLNFENTLARSLFNDWDFATKDIENFNYLGSEEIIMTILAWQRKLCPTGYFFDHVIVSNEQPDTSQISKSIEFYFDRVRE